MTSLPTVRIVNSFADSRPRNGARELQAVKVLVWKGSEEKETPAGTGVSESVRIEPADCTSAGAPLLQIAAGK